MHLPGLNRLRQNIANAIAPTADFLRNQYNEAFLWGVGGGQTQWDPTNEVIIEKGYNINPLVYSPINQMATKTANIPFSVKKIEDEGAKRKLDALNYATKGDYSVQQKIKSLLLENKAFAKADIAFPMERPNATQTWGELWALYKTFIKSTGNAYFYMLSPEDGINAGVPIQMYLLPSQFVQIVVKDINHLLTTESPIDYYMLVEGRSFIEFPAEDVIHIKYPNPNYGQNGEHLYGMSPLRAALRNIESSDSSLNLNIKTLKSGGAFGFIHGKKMALTKDQASEIKERLNEMNTSPEDLSKIAGISAEVGFTRLSLTSDELKPFDYLAFDKAQIENVLIWPDDSGSRGDFGGTIKEIRKQRITDNIIPDLNLLTQALNSQFLPRFKGFENTVIVFDPMELPEMQSDIKEMSAWLNENLDNGVINRNEVRKAIQYPESELPEMEIFTVQDDIISLEDALDNDFNVDPLKKNFNLKDFNPNQPRDRSGRWTGSGWHGISTKTQVDSHTKEGGSTFTMDGKNQAGAKGMASVATFPERSITLKGALTADALNDYIELNKDILEGSDKFAVGTWFDSETGVTWLDIITVTDLNDAIRLGIEHNQIAIFDLENMDEVSTGGTGE